MRPPSAGRQTFPVELEEVLRRSLLSVYALTRLAVGLEPPSVPGAAAPYAPIRLRGKFGSPAGRLPPVHSAITKNCRIRHKPYPRRSSRRIHLTARRISALRLGDADHAASLTPAGIASRLRPI